MDKYIQLISTVGFPIFACGAMGWYVKYITDQLITKVQQALENNTNVLTVLCEKLEIERSEIE